MNFTSQGFNFSKMQYKIYMGGSISQNELNKIIKDPTHALINSLDFRSKVAYGIPKMVISPFSYQYNYPFVEKQCMYNQILHKNAINDIIQNHPEFLSNFQNNYIEYKKNIEKYKSLYTKKTTYCKKSLYLNKAFFLIPVNTHKIWHYFPK